ncbi:60S ribosomal protein L32-1 [Sesamum angolense]|uniref:60S ribosomal protein L32-1 n=1 Tax=Sesamum angolense TaxID=2727404 RepID=A0AAE1XC38_9LAMI|nr:60S ribosomal protein L32-1 [Sesamum angolense]
MAVPLLDKKIVKKRVKKFKRHQSDRFISVKVISYYILLIRNTIHSYWIGSKLMTNWRRPKGIDSRVRRKFKGCTLMPNIGYGSDKKTRHYLPNGFKKFVVHNVKELEVLMMHNRTYCAEIAHNVSTKKRKDIVERAAQLDIVVTNKLARLRSQEDDQPTRPSTFSWFPVMEALARRRLALFASHVSPPAGTSLPTCLSASACASHTNGDKQIKKGDSSVCVFCKIIGGEAPAVKSAKVQHWKDSEKIIAAMCSKVPLISNAVMKATGCDSFNLLVNNGAAAGQVIYHTHIHIIPRKAHDCLWTSESLPRRWLKLDQEASQLANRIRESIVFVNNYESDDSKGQASSLVELTREVIDCCCCERSYNGLKMLVLLQLCDPMDYR